MTSSYCPQKCNYYMNFCRLANHHEAVNFLQIQDHLTLPIKRQKISLKKISQFKQFTNRISKPDTNKHWEDMTRTGTCRHTERKIIRPNYKNRQEKQNVLLNNNCNNLITRRKAMKSTEITSRNHVFKHQCISARDFPKVDYMDQLRLGLKMRQIPKNSVVTTSLTERWSIPHIYQTKNSKTDNQSVLPLIKSPKYFPSPNGSSATKFISQFPISESIPIVNESQRRQRDFQKEYETVNSVFSDSVIDERVSESTVEIDFFHPSRGRAFDKIEENEQSSQNSSQNRLNGQKR